MVAIARCGCAGFTGCACLVAVKGALSITGSGGASNQYVIDGPHLAGNPTSTLDVEVAGAGTESSPWLISVEGDGGGGGGGAVDSVNGETGTVVLSAADVGAATTAQGAKADTAVQPEDIAVNVKDYGAVGDGIADDRVAIQAALTAAAAAKATVVGKPGSVYRLGSSQTVAVRQASGSTTSMATCLVIPSGVMLDLRDCVLKLDTTATVFINAGAVAAAAKDTLGGGVNLVIDGNNAADGFWLSHITNVDGWRFDVRATSVAHGGFYIFDADRIYSDRMDVVGCAGQPFTIGTYTAARTGMVRGSRFGKITARNVTPGVPYVNFPGNAFYGELAESTIDVLSGIDCAAGVKIGATAMDLSIGSVEAIRCGDVNNNSGFKLQGDFPGVTDGPQRVSVGTVVAKDNTGNGLYLSNSIDCTIGSYIGDNNGINGTSPDLWLSGTRDVIGNFSSTRPKTQGILVRAAAKDYRLGQVVIRNAGQTLGSGSSASCGVIAESGSIGEINSLLSIDDQTPATMNRGLNVVGTARIHLNRVVCHGMVYGMVFSATAHAIALNTQLDATAPTYGEVTLTAAATITNIANANFFIFGTAMSPIVELVRVNAAARALTSLYWLTPTGGQLRLTHSAAAGTEIIAWRLVGYRAGGTVVT